MVIARKIEELRPERIEDQDTYNYLDFDLSESDNEQREQQQQPPTQPDNGDKAELKVVEAAGERARRRKERHQAKKLDMFHRTMETDGILRVNKHMGARKWRRVENARVLLSLTDKEDICEDYSDLVPNTDTTFTRLFADRENMKAWNSFIAKDEAAQRQFLEEAGQGGRREEEMSGDGWFVVGGRPTPRKEKTGGGDEGAKQDSRSHHPAYSGRACFERLDAKFKSLFSRKKMCWDVVDSTERSLLAFFGQSGSPAEAGDASCPSDGVWVSCLESSMDRLCVHGVAQWLGLHSQSVTCSESGMRLTEVRCRRAFFVPPREMLIAYLNSKGARIEVVRMDEDEEEGVQVEKGMQNLDISLDSTGSESSSLSAGDFADVALSPDLVIV